MESPIPNRSWTNGQNADLIYTIGHSNNTMENFISLLRRHGITAVVDVRSSPTSGYNPQFNGNALSVALRKEKIAYVFMGKELGGRPDDPSDYENGRANYSRMADKPAFREGIDRLIKNAAKYRMALLCAEKEPLECHRTIMVSRALHKSGINIKHILADGNIEDHKDTETRLVKSLGIKPNLFEPSSPAELIEKAYNQQAIKIAYKPKHEKDNDECRE